MTRHIRPIRIDGDIAFIPLTKGYEAIIDATDVPLVDGFNWFAVVKPRSVYALRDRGSGSTRGAVYLHRVILGDPSAMEVDHIDCNGLNNRRYNLRLVTSAQNKFNQRTRTDNASGFKGVCWSKHKRKWRSYIMLDGNQMHLGYHDTPEAAHAVYVEASARLHGTFGRAS